MDPRLKLALLAAGLVLAGAALYGLLRWLERRGWVNLKGSGRGLASGIGVVQEIYDPPARHVQQVREHERNAPEPGDPPR